MLTRNLNFQSKFSYSNSESLEYGDLNGDGTVETIIKELTSGNGFTPIKHSTTGAFSGNFDGKG